MKIQNSCDRAKIFMPFDALKGFREALSRKERVVVPKCELSEEACEELDQALRRLRKNDFVTAVYYENGEYVSCTGMVSALDAAREILRIVHRDIPFDALRELREHSETSIC